MAIACRATMEVSDFPSCERGSVEGNVIVEAIGSRYYQRVKQERWGVVLPGKQG
jgi:hypothetical protein